MPLCVIGVSSGLGDHDMHVYPESDVQGMLFSMLIRGACDL